MINNLKQELSSLKSLFTNILIFPTLPILLPIIITLVMFLPQNIQDSLKLHYHNPQWWQLLSNAFVHQNFAHYSSNLQGLIFLLIFEVVLVTLIMENKRYYKLLLITIIVVPFLTSLLELYYTSIGTLFYQINQTGCGISGVLYAISGFIPILSLTYFSKRIDKNILNRWFLLLIVSYACFAFLVSAYLHTGNLLISILSFIFLLSLIAVIVSMFIIQKEDYKKVITIIKNDWLVNFKIITFIVLFTLLGLFLITPWQLLNELVANGSFVDFIAHFTGLMLGVLISYFVFKK